MIEPPELIDARRRLARAESALFAKDAAFELEEGLALLQELAESGDPQASRVARNVARAYAVKVYSTIRTLLSADRNVPEPQLEHLFRLVLIFDAADTDLPSDAREIKISLGRALLNRYLEGHAAEEKRAALEELMRIAESSSHR